MNRSASSSVLVLEVPPARRRATRRTTLIAAFLGLFAAVGNAQEWIGFADNTVASLTDRGTLGTAAGEVLVRLDAREHGGWGTDAGPNRRTVSGIRVAVIDRNPFTPESFTLTLHNEVTPGVPGVGIPFGPPSLPVPGTLTVIETKLPACASVVVPLTFSGHVFVSIHLPANVAWPLDGLEVGVVDGVGADVPGPSYLTRRHNLERIGLGAYLPQPTVGHYYVDVLQGGCGTLVAGVGGTVTSQLTYPVSGVIPGTSDFLSGSFPSVPRGDLICMTARAGAALAFMPVAFLVSFGPLPSFASEIQLGSIYLGSTGVLCAYPFDVASISLLDGNGYADTCYPLPVWALGMEVTHQAVVITTAATFHSGPCDHQHL